MQLNLIQVDYQIYEDTVKTLDKDKVEVFHDHGEAGIKSKETGDILCYHCFPMDEDAEEVEQFWVSPDIPQEYFKPYTYKRIVLDNWKELESFLNAVGRAQKECENSAS